jgi:hypothetical protein
MRTSKAFKYILKLTTSTQHEFQLINHFSAKNITLELQKAFQSFKNIPQQFLITSRVSSFILM